MAGWPVYSTCFFAGRITPAGIATLYTVPDGFVAVLSDVCMFTLASGTNVAYIEDDSGYPVGMLTSTGVADAQRLSCRQVFDAGVGMCINAAAGEWFCRYSGSLISLP